MYGFICTLNVEANVRMCEKVLYGKVLRNLLDSWMASLLKKYIPISLQEMKSYIT